MSDWKAEGVIVGSITLAVVLLTGLSLVLNEVTMPSSSAAARQAHQPQGKRSYTTAPVAAIASQAR